MIRYGVNEFKNPNDNSVSVTINDGILKELGIRKGNIDDNYKSLYAYDALGNKIKIPVNDAFIQSLGIMSDEQIDTIRNRIFGDVSVMPSTITGITPFIIKDSDKGQDAEFIIYGRNMNVNETATTKLVLLDEVTKEEIVATTWSALNNYSIHAVFKIPTISKSTKLKPMFKVGDDTLNSTAELLIKPELEFEKIELQFTTDSKVDKDYTLNESNIILSPLYNSEIGSDCLNVLSSKIDGNRDFIIDIDLSFNTKEGANLNVFDLTRTGIGIGMFDEKNGNSWIDYVNLDVSDFKPRFGTFFVKDNVRHIKFIKLGNSLVKLLWTETSVHTSKLILTPVEDFRLIAKGQRLSLDGTIKEIKFSNIRVNYF